MLRSQRSSSAYDRRQLADEGLMELVRGGDARAFEVVFDRHARAAFSLAYRVCGSRARAADVVQDAFMSLWRKSAQYDPVRGSVRAWILSAACNRSIDLLRSELVAAPREPLETRAEQLRSADGTATEVERGDDARRVRRALHELPADQRRAIELAHLGGFSHGQIAELLELPTGTVKGRMRLGLTKLRLALGELSEGLR